MPHKSPDRYSRPPSYGPTNEYLNMNTPPPVFKPTIPDDDFAFDLPSVPNSHPNNNDIDDLDDLTRRFQNLKNNK